MWSGDASKKRPPKKETSADLMCGIAGLVVTGSGGVDPSRLKAMTEILSHRGMDDAGYAFLSQDWRGCSDPAFAHKNPGRPALDGGALEKLSASSITAGFGHRRLAIIDLSPSGHQPMISSDGRYCVVFNGEIYNHPQIRDSLQRKGRKFHGRSDTETLLNLWDEHGGAAVEELDGMFAFAIYDRVSGRLTLARDRYGMKPLYYSVSSGHFIFASEPKAILASGLIQARISPPALVEYFTFQNIFSDRTLFEGIHLLPPGTIMTVERDGGMRKEIYHPGWEAGPPAYLRMDDAAPRVRDLFISAVKRQMISDVDVGSFLSGGMDSGSIVMVAGGATPKLSTFTVGFDLTNVNGIEQGFDEREQARRISALAKTDHHDIALHAGDMPSAMEKLSWHIDDPRVGICHQNWYAAKLASGFVKVCLTGTGGDELFAGYSWRYRPAFESADARSFDDALFRYWHRLLGPDEIGGLFSSDVRNFSGAARESFDAVMAHAPGAGAVSAEGLMQRCLHFEFKTFLHGLLVIEDRVSMAHGMESRSPFLDNALAALACSIPPALKLNLDAGGPQPSADNGKLVLREAMKGLLPDSVIRQRKQGFSPPDENWYRGPSVNYIKEILLDNRTLSRPWFDNGFVKGRLDEHFSGRRNNRLLIWSLLSFEWLLRHWVDGKV